MILIDEACGSGFEMRRGKIRDSELIQPLAAKVSCKVRVAKLPSGDVAFEGNGPDNSILSFGLERKQIGELMGSIRSGRYAGDQLIRMHDDYDVVYLIVEGIYKPDSSGVLCMARYGKGFQPLTLGKSKQYFLYSELDKFLANLEVLKNVIVLRSGSAGETVNMIANRWSWWQKPYEEHHATDALKTQNLIGVVKPSLCRMVAAQLPGIGWEKSKVVSNHFLSVTEMCTADRWEWEELEGIGKKTADRVWKALRGIE